MDRKQLAALLAQLPPTAIANAASFQFSINSNNVNASGASTSLSSSAQVTASSTSSSKLSTSSPQHLPNGSISSPDAPNRKSSIIGKGTKKKCSKIVKTQHTCEIQIHFIMLL